MRRRERNKPVVSRSGTGEATDDLLRPGLGFIFRSTVLASSSGRLLERLLLWGVGVADLDDVILVLGLGQSGVVEGLDNGLADVAALKAVRRLSVEHKNEQPQEDSPCKTDATAGSVAVAKDARRLHLEAVENLGELVLVQGLGQVRDVEVGVAGLRELLQLAVEGLAGERGLVATPGEGADAVLSILKAEVLDEAEPVLLFVSSCSSASQ